MKDSKGHAPRAITASSRAARREPRLPHERDQSSDPQTPVIDETRTLGKQAARDVEHGLVDTDRGPVLERLSAEHFAPSVKRGARKRR
jgi:hypothetical protein